MVRGRNRRREKRQKTRPLTSKPQPQPQPPDATAGAIAGTWCKVHWPTVYLKHLDILGCMVADAEDFEELVAMIADGGVKPVVAATFPLPDLRAAQARFKRKDFVGKIVIDCTRLESEHPDPVAAGAGAGGGGGAGTGRGQYVPPRLAVAVGGVAVAALGVVAIIWSRGRVV